MKNKLELLINHSREKLNLIEDKITELNFIYMDLLDEDEDNIHLKKIENEINYLERQQDIIVRHLRDKKQQLAQLM